LIFLIILLNWKFNGMNWKIIDPFLTVSVQLRVLVEQLIQSTFSQQDYVIRFLKGLNDKFSH
jgi:hypothetical protein